MSASLEYKPGRTALIIIDMQNAFVRKEGSLSRMGLDCSRVLRAIGPVRELKAACVAAKLPVIYLQHVHRADGLDAGLIDKVFPPILQLGHCFKGSWDAEIIEELAPAPGDIVVEKGRFSGFHGTVLASVLSRLGVEDLIVCGIATNVCVESTVRDAFYRDINVFVPAESTASFFEAAETAALDNFRFAFARVLPLAEMLGKLRG